MLIFPPAQLGVTLASLALGWIGEQFLAQMLSRSSAWSGFISHRRLSQTVAFALAFSLITFSAHRLWRTGAQDTSPFANPLPAALLAR